MINYNRFSEEWIILTHGNAEVRRRICLPGKNRRLQSWIPPSFVWTIVPEVFCLEVPISDPDVVEFISIGEQKCIVVGSKKAALCISVILGKETLRSQVAEAVWVSTRLKPRGQRVNSGMKLVAYCHGVFLLPGEESLCVLVGRSKPIRSDHLIPAALKAKADVLLLDHKSEVAEFKTRIECKRQTNADFFGNSHDIEKFKTLADSSLAMEEVYQAPVLTADGLLPFLPRAVLFPQTSLEDLDKIARSAIAAVAGSNMPPSRDGIYTGILPSPAGRKAQAIVSWVPHAGLPSYPEVRRAVQRRLRTALRSPRIQNLGPPKFDTGVEPVDDSVQLGGFDPGSTNLGEALDDLLLDDRDFRNRVDEVRKDLQIDGFEAIAWFQPYHVWTEETWGIYFDAQKLDDLAYSFLEDFKDNRLRGSHSLAAFLALGLTYAHELFHAKVEAALSWLELNALKPRHLRYKQRVYDTLSETPAWLEEALANWSAWDWFNADATQAVIAQMTPHSQGLERIVEDSLDLAPPGYQEWRLGAQLTTWRTFTTQLATGVPKLASPGIGLPIESALTGAPPYDFQPTDIPLRFIGQGGIADKLQSHPATFNVPPRREIERALRHFNHNLDTSRGKGAHQMWTGPDQRAFILPTRDPVSTKVFNSFLHHVGIDKATYVRRVRPNL